MIIHRLTGWMLNIKKQWVLFSRLGITPYFSFFIYVLYLFLLGCEVSVYQNACILIWFVLDLW